MDQWIKKCVCCMLISKENLHKKNSCVNLNGSREIYIPITFPQTDERTFQIKE